MSPAVSEQRAVRHLVDGTAVRQRDVLYSLERKTAGVTAHYDPVQDMASLVHRHVYELNQVVVVQQSLQLVNIAIGRVFKTKVKITNKREISACMTIQKPALGILQRTFCLTVCFACWEGDDINKSPRLMCYHEMMMFHRLKRVERQRMHGNGVRQRGLKHDCNAATPAADAWERAEEVATRGHLCDVSLVTTGVKPGFRHQQNIQITINNEIVYFAGLLAA